MIASVINSLYNIILEIQHSGLEASQDIDSKVARIARSHKNNRRECRQCPPSTPIDNPAIEGEKERI